MSKSHDLGNDPEPPWRRRLPSLDMITKALGVLAIVFYSIGLVIQNLYLASLGVTDFELLRARSILTGILCAALLLVFTFPILAVYLAAFDNKTEPPRVRRRFAWTSLGICLIVSPLLLYGLVKKIGEAVPISFVLSKAGIAFFQLALIPVLFSLIMFLIYSKEGESKKEKSASLPVALACYAMLAPVGLIFIYPHVNPEFGGGRPMPVVLMLNSEGREVWHRLHKDYDDSVDPFVQLLHERETTLVVRDNKTPYDGTNENTTLVIDKKLIRAFVPRPGVYDFKLSKK